MRWLRTYIRAIVQLMRPAHSLDAHDVGEWALRRVVARSLIALPLIPMVLLGMWVWEGIRDGRRAAALQSSLCVTLVPIELLPRSTTLSGTAADGRCEGYWASAAGTELEVRWRVKDSHSLGPHFARRKAKWDWERDVTVSEVEDGRGQRFFLLEPVHQGWMEIRPGDHVRVEALVAGIASRLEE